MFRRLRALNALVGGFLFFFGTTLILFGVDGAVPLGVGAGMLAVDLFVEHRTGKARHVQ